MRCVACEKVSLARPAVLVALFFLMLPMAMLWLNRYTNLDILLADAMFDPVTRSFPWKYSWLADKFAHGWLKMALVVLGCLVVIVTAWDVVRPIARWSHAFRIRMRVLACSAMLVPLVIGTLKRFSPMHCPWDVDRYGGTAPYFKLFDVLPMGVAPGHCFPAGHVSSALWLVAIAVFWLPYRPRIAGMAAGAMLLFGFALGWLQQLRGAHFLSHTLWSMWIACVVIAFTYVMFILRDARE